MFLFGCAAGKYVFSEDPPDLQRNTSIVMGGASSNIRRSNNWVGGNVKELVLRYGEPDLVIETVPKGVALRGAAHRTVGYLYYSNPGYGDECINTYVVHPESGEIVAYYCR